MKRLTKLWMMAAAAGILLLGGCAGKPAAGSGAALPETIRPEAVRKVVAADNAHGGTIMGQMKDQKEAAVEYRAGGGNWKTQEASSQKISGNQGEPDRYIYEAELTGLTPGASYEYRVRAGGEVSPAYKLSTDSGGEFTALLFPDSQSLDYNVWKETAEGGRKTAPDAAFYINMGDLVDNGQDEHQWQSWLASVSSFSADIPLAPVMGNHEAYSLDWKMAKPDRYLAHFDLPKNGDSALPEMFYSFDWGPVHFSVLNTDMQELSEWYPDLLEKQKAWLVKDVKSTEKPWKVVLMHKDPLQYRIAKRPERKEGFSEEGKAFMPLFDQLGIDAVLSAHLHTYRNRGHIYDFQRDVKGPLYILSGVAGDVRYPNLWTDHALDTYVAPQPETDNFMTLTASDQTLTLRAFLPDGTKLDEAVLTK